MPHFDDPAVSFDDEAVFFDDDAEGEDLGGLPYPPPNLAKGTSSMENWEITKQRAQITLSIWNLHAPALTIGAVGPAAFEGLIAQFEPAAQARTTAQDAYDEARRLVERALLKMKILGTKVPQIIEGQVPDDQSIMDDLKDLYGPQVRSEPTILARARGLQPVWVRANAVLAALTPPAGPITRPLGGVPQTAAMLKTMLDTYTDLTSGVTDTGAALKKKKFELEALDHKVDQLNKNWYQVMKNTYDEGSPEREALEAIPVETGTPAPTAIEIAEVVQGDEDGLHLVATYEAGGGDHATTREVQWMVEGVDADFTHTLPLEAAGNTFGPFAVGQVVRVRTSVSNSSGTRTSAVRTITIEEPID